jgi:hypothetical protein
MHTDVIQAPSLLHIVDVIFDWICPFVDLEAKPPVINITTTPATIGIKIK